MDWIERALDADIGKIVAVPLAAALVFGAYCWAWYAFGLLSALITWQWGAVFTLLPWVLLPFAVMGTLELLATLWNRRTKRCV